MHGPGMCSLSSRCRRPSAYSERPVGMPSSRSMRNKSRSPRRGGNLRDCGMTLPSRRVHGPGVFLFRYEPNAVVRALGQPIASAASGGVSPIVYRFDLRDGKSSLLAQQLPVEDKDVIFVADAPAVRSFKFAPLLSSITGPIITGLLVCQTGK